VIVMTPTLIVLLLVILAVVEYLDHLRRKRAGV